MAGLESEVVTVHRLYEEVLAALEDLLQYIIIISYFLPNFNEIPLNRDV